MDTSSKALPKSLEKGAASIQETAKLLPETPGVYRMLNPRNEVLYVGKAKNLKRRVLSYTQTDKLSRRIKQMVAQTDKMEIVHTQTEAEALLLETNLIKKLSPRYNILFRDGKTLPYIFLSEGPWPFLIKRRKNTPAKGDYFGPFASIDALHKTLSILYKAFLIRSCPDTVFANRKRPCLQYHIKRCSAPCVNKVIPEAYRQTVQQARAVLLGKSKEVHATLVKEMEIASNAKAYERAALLRNRIQALSKIQAHQSI
ncbi:MAG: GIY-YIG nuclease family protein, partial [Alphaproteobacteria bacterium]